MELKLNEYLVAEFSAFLEGKGLKLEEVLDMTQFQEFLQIKSDANAYIADDLIALQLADYYQFLELTTHKDLTITSFTEERENFRVLEVPQGRIKYKNEEIPLLGTNEYLLANGYYSCLKPMLKEMVTDPNRSDIGFTIFVTGEQDNTYYQEQVSDLEELIKELEEECNYKNGVYITNCGNKTKRLTVYSGHSQNEKYRPGYIN